MLPRSQDWVVSYVVDEEKWPDWRFRAFFPISPARFKQLCRDLHEPLQRLDTKYKLSNTAETKILCALLRLGKSASYIWLSEKFGIGKQSVARAITEFCDAMIDQYLADIIRLPTVGENVEQLAWFSAWCGLPCVIGAVDGSHTLIHASPISAQDQRSCFTFAKVCPTRSAGWLL